MFKLPVFISFRQQKFNYFHIVIDWTQIPFEDNPGHMPTFTQSLSLEFESDYGTGLLGNEDHNKSSEIDPVMFSFHGEPKVKLAQQQDDLKSNSASEVPSEETVSYPLSVRRTLLDRDESLRKVDSFNRWITKALGEVDNLNMQSSSGISWSTDECGHVIDDTSLSPSLSQDQLYSINDFSPKWACAESDIEVLILGRILSIIKKDSNGEKTKYQFLLCYHPLLQLKNSAIIYLLFGFLLSPSSIMRINMYYMWHFKIPTTLPLVRCKQLSLS